MRAFVQLRKIFHENDILKYALEGLRKQVATNTHNIQRAFDLIADILEPHIQNKRRKKIGFKPTDKKIK
jgi:hypothetical protein